MTKLLCVLFLSFGVVFAQTPSSQKLDSLITNIQGKNDSNTLALIYDIGKISWNTKDIISLKKAGAVLETYSINNKNDKLKAQANLCNGMAFSLSNQYDKGFFYLFGALRICEKNGLYDMGVSVNNILAYNYFNLNNYSKAIDYAENSIRYLNKSSMGKSIYYVDSYRIIGEAYLQINKPDLGKIGFTKALDYAILDNDSQGIQYIYYSIANVFVKANKTDSAKYFINKAATISKALNDSSFYQYIYQSLASIALKDKDYNQCLKYITLAFKVNSKFNDLGLKKDIMNLLTQYYQEKKDYYNAFIHSQIAKNISDSLGSLEVNKKIMELEALFESNKAAAQITELNNINTLNNLKMKTEQREKNALLIVLFISLLAVFIIGYVLYQKSKVVQNLDRLNKEKTEMMGILSHDLRSPLTKIHALNSILLEQNNLSQHKTTFDRINSIIKEATELIQNLLDISTIETQPKNLHIEQIDIIDELLLLKEEYMQMARRKGISIQFDFDGNDLLISTNRLKLKRVLDNLISNAIKYSPLSSSITIKVYDDSHKIVFSVSDKGIGLTEAEQTGVFDKFPNLSVKPTMGESATGMGLFITKQLVTILKGHIEVNSVKYEGSTFTVKLPKNYYI